jgi:hypothetical protein
VRDSETRWGDVAGAACTLPTVERPLRVAEFDELFGAAVISVERLAAGRARFGVRRDSATAARAAELVVRETECCSFFEFVLTTTGRGVALDVIVPAAQIAVLDALADRAVVVLARDGQ